MKAAIAGHPIHAMLILLPGGAFVLTLLLDGVYIVTGAEVWWWATLPVLTLGVLGALLAAVPGFIDWLGIDAGDPAKRLGTWHMILNLGATTLFAYNAWIRWEAAGPPGQYPYFAFWVTLAGVGLLGVAGWLGGSMVYEHGVGVSAGE